MTRQRAYSTLGKTALVNFPNNTKKSEKIKFAKELIRKNKSIHTVLEKSGIFKGRLRCQETKYLAGIKTKEIIYRENGCEFKFNIDSTYFSPRLSNERIEITKEIRINDIVLVMFAGVAPFPIVIAKNSKAKKIYSNELNSIANKYALVNIKKNKLENRIELIPGDIKKVCVKLQKDKKNYDVIVMARPQLDDSFLEDAFKVVKIGTRVYYYDFCKVEDREKIVSMVKNEAVKAGYRIKITRTKNAGEIAPYKVRYRVDFVVLGKNNWLGRILGKLGF